MRLIKRLLIAALGCYLLAAGAISVSGLIDHVAPADAIVVLGTTVERDGTPSARLQARLDGALKVYRQGAAPLIIVSGGLGVEGYDEAAVMAGYLTGHGVPASAVLRDSAGNNTSATARNVARVARERNLNSVVVATQYFHVPRARFALERAGVPVAGTVHAEYFELRDLYSIAREVVAFSAYYAGFRGPRP